VVHGLVILAAPGNRDRRSTRWDGVTIIASGLPAPVISRRVRPVDR
jgi:hypothetical protein